MILSLIISLFVATAEPEEVEDWWIDEIETAFLQDAVTKRQFVTKNEVNK